MEIQNKVLLITGGTGSFNILDSNKIKNEFNWKAETNLKEGLITLWNWYKTNNL